MTCTGGPTLETGGSRVDDQSLTLNRKSHQRSWWIVHIRPTDDATFRTALFPSARASSRASWRARRETGMARGAFLGRRHMNNPPTALVGLRPRARSRAALGFALTLACTRAWLLSGRPRFSN